MCNATETTVKKIHPFEERGLGLAPFTYVGSYEDRGPRHLANGLQIGAPGQPMGTCDYCGQGIAHCFQIRSADGKQFVVGCDCVAKTNREAASTAEQRALVKKVDQIVKDRQRAARKTREHAKLEEAREWLDAHRATLEAMPNPDRKGESLWQKVEWFRRNAGVSGMLRLTDNLRRLLAE